MIISAVARRLISLPCLRTITGPKKLFDRRECSLTKANRYRLNSWFRRWTLSTAATVAVIIASGTSAASATTLTVTSALDRSEAGRLTLREALVQSRPKDRVIFDDTLREQTIRLDPSRGPLIANTVAIDAGKVIDIRIDGLGIATGPFLRATSCSIHGLTFLNARDCAVNLTGKSTITDCRFQGNRRAIIFDGSGVLKRILFQSNGDPRDRSAVLTIASRGSVHLAHCTFSNDLMTDLLVQSGTVSAVDCRIVNSSGGYAAIINYGDLALDNGIIDGCEELGIYSARSLRMRNTIVRNIGTKVNAAFGIVIQDTHGPGNLYMDNCTVENCWGEAIYFGKGHQFIMNRCKVLSNHRGGVGVNACHRGGLVLFDECTFARNNLWGIRLFNVNLPGNEADYAIHNSTISNNVNSIGLEGVGAAIIVRTERGIGFGTNPVTVTIDNSTISGNSSSGPGNGGGLAVVSDFSSSPEVRVILKSSTIANNTVLNGRGGGVYVSPLPNAVLELQNTIIANNRDMREDAPDISGSLISRGFNFIGKIEGSSGYIVTDQTGTVVAPLDPMLNILRDNGGPTETMALLPISPARHSGDPQFIGQRDQRGVIRREADIGAYVFNK